MKPRVLLLTHRAPYPPDRGDRIRAWHLLKFLAERAEVSLGSTTDEAVSPAARAKLQSQCEDLCIAPLPRWRRLVRAASAVMGAKSISERMFQSPELSQQLQAWQRQRPFEAVVVYCSSMFPYVDNAAFAGVPRLVDLIDVDSQKWSDYAASARVPRKWIYAREAGAIGRLERRIVAKADAVTVTTPQEAALLRRNIPSAQPWVVGNGVDHAYFQPQGESIPGRVAFVGVLNYRPNVQGLLWFIEHVWDSILAAAPHATLEIVGRRPVAALRRWHGRKNIRICADVPDVRPHVAAAEVVIAPLQIARGIQNKVLEAMAMERPVVVSQSVGRGLEAMCGEQFVGADTAEEWRVAILDLLSNAPRAKRIAAAGRAFVERAHVWSQTLAPIGEWLDHRLSQHEGENAATFGERKATIMVSAP